MIRFLDPTAGPATGKLILRDRLNTLNGKKLAVLWNGRTHGDKILRRMLEFLREKYDFQVVDFLKKPYIGNIAPKEYFDRIFQDRADAAIVGIGD
jgi:hypothetical protein